MEYYSRCFGFQDLVLLNSKYNKLFLEERIFHGPVFEPGTPFIPVLCSLAHSLDVWMTFIEFSLFTLIDYRLVNSGGKNGIAGEHNCIYIIPDFRLLARFVGLQHVCLGLQQLFTLV